MTGSPCGSADDGAACRVFIHHSTGSHHPNSPVLRVTLAMHNRDLKRKTLMCIIEQAGYSVEEFLDLL